MAAIQPSLFSWTDVEAESDLDRFTLARDHLPDERIIQYLEVMRGNGRDDYPVRAMWNAVIAGVVFQHPSMASLVRELKRNPALLQVCGFNILPVQKRPVAQLTPDPDGGRPQVVWPQANPAVCSSPDEANFSRFLSNLIELEDCLGLVTGMIPALRESLMQELPDFGQHLGFDGKAKATAPGTRIGKPSERRIRMRTGENMKPSAWMRAPASRGRRSRAGSDTDCI